MGSKVLAEPIFTGRERELKELTLHLNSAIEGRGATVFISGEAGSGKTRLISEFLHSAREKDAAILSGWCLGNSSTPYFPFIEAFKDYFSIKRKDNHTVASTQNLDETRNDEEEIKSWLMSVNQTESISRYGSLTPQAWKDLFFAAVVKALLAISARKPTILFLEDIHWGDSASLGLLHYIARAIESERILLLATFRSEELTVDAEGKPHPLVETLRLMGREELFTEIRLLNLSQTYVKTVAENMLGGSLDKGFIDRLGQESSGNALFVVELLRMLIERKGIVQEQKTWHLATEKLEIPSKIRDIILQRLSILKFNQRRIIDAASVIGEKFTVDLLSAVLGQEYLEVLETVNVIAKSTSLLKVEGDSYRFDHAKSRDAVYEEIPLPLKRGYHIKIAERLESLKDKLLLSDLAYHYSQAGNKEKATKYAISAGKDALLKWSNTEAIKYFSQALEASRHAPENNQDTLTALEGLGDAYLACSSFEDAIKAYDELANSATDNVKARAYRKEMDAVFFKNEPARLMELVNKVEKYVADNRLESARAQVNRGRALAYQGDIEAGIHEWEHALEIFEEEYALGDAAVALLGIGFRRSQVFQDHKRGLNQLLRSIALFQEVEDLQNGIDAVQTTAFTLLMAGLYEEAEPKLLDGFKMSQKIGDFRRMSFNFFAQGLIAELTGNHKEAIEQAMKALEYNKKTDAPDYVHTYTTLIRQYVLLEDLERAEKYYNKLMELPAKTFTQDRGSFFWGTLGKAVFFAAKNRYEQSQHYFDEILGKKLNVNTKHATNLFYAWALQRQGKLEEAEAVHKEIGKMFEEVKQRYAHCDVKANLMIHRSVTTGEEFELRLDLVNVARKPAILTKVGNLVSLENFRVVNRPVWCNLVNDGAEFQRRVIGAFEVETIKLVMVPKKTGTFTFNPQVFYVDDLGQTKTCNLKPTAITVNLPAQKQKVEGKISMGTSVMDHLLFGGIPYEYSIALIAASSDERALLIKRFLEAGIEANETTFCLTTQVKIAQIATEKNLQNLYVFLCNPRIDQPSHDLPNFFKIKGVENLTEIDIALAKAFRMIDSSEAAPKRVCIELVSDVLLQHHAVNTRKWLSGLLPELTAKGFTTLAIINPKMHPPEELQSILGLFDGEISVYEKETEKGTIRFVKINRMTDRKYLKDEVALIEE